MGRRRLQRIMIWRRMSSIRGRVFRRLKHICRREGYNSFKWCFNYIEKQCPNLSKEEVHVVMKGIYDEVYLGNNSIVLHYQELIRKHVSTQGAGVMEMHPAKVLKVYQNLLMYWKESDQRMEIQTKALR
jgi:hypothetical protein